MMQPPCQQPACSCISHHHIVHISKHVRLHSSSSAAAAASPLPHLRMREAAAAAASASCCRLTSSLSFSSCYRAFTLSRLFLLLLLLCSLSRPAAACSDPSSVSCSVCPSSSRSNDISGLPRVSASGQLVSHDLGDFNWYTCDAFGDNCQSFLDSPQVSHWLNPIPDAADPINYVQSVAAYCLLALGCCVVSLYIALAMGCWRYCSDRHLGGLCGGIYPTRKLRYIGVVIDPQRKVWVYRPWERWAARCLMLTFVALTLVWVGLGYWQGTTVLPAAAQNAIDSPSALAATLQSTQPPLLQLISAFAGQTLLEGIANVSRAFEETASLPTMLTDLQCVTVAVTAMSNISLSQSLPDSSLLTAQTAQTQAAVDAAFTVSLASLLSPLSSSLTSLSSYSASSLSTASLLSSAASNVSSLIPKTAAVQSLGSGIDVSVSTFSSHAPNASFLTAVANGSYASLARLVPPDSTDYAPIPSAAERQTLLWQWGNLTSTLAELPNLTAVADDMTAYNTAAHTATIALNQTLSALSIAMAASALSDSSLSAANLSITAFTTAAANFNLSAETVMVQGLNASITGAMSASYTAVTANAANLSTLTAAVSPCLSALIPALNATNALLITLADGLEQLMANFSTLLNTSTSASLAALRNISYTLSNLSSGNAVNLNVGSLLSALDASAASIGSISSSPAATNLTLYNAVLASQARLSVTLSADYALLSSVSAALSASLMPAATIASLSLYGAHYTALAPNLTAFQSSLNIWDDQDRGVKRCHLATATNCSVNSQCTAIAGDRCTLDSNAIAVLQQQITGLTAYYPSNSSLDAVNATTAAFTASLSAAALPGMNHSLYSLSTAEQLKPAAVLAAESGLQSVYSELLAANTTALDGEFGQLSTNLTNQLSFPAAQLAPITALTVTLSELSTELIAVNETVQLLTVLDEFLSIFYPYFIAPQLIALANQSSSVSNMTLQLASIVQQVVNYLDQSTEIGELFPFANFTSRTELLRERLDLVYTSEYLQYGSMHYLANIFNLFYSAFVTLNADNFQQYCNDSISNFSTFNQLANRVNADYNGNSYGESVYCLTDACISNTIHYYSTTSINGITSGTVPLSVTLQDLNGLLYLIPTLIAILGLTALLCWRKYSYASKISCATVAMMLIFLPLIFLLAMATFPVLMLQGDVCYGGANVAYDVLIAKQDTVCADIGGTGTADNCQYSLDGFSVLLNVPQLYTDVMGGDCDGELEDNAVLSAFNSIRASAVTWPTGKISTALVEFSNNSLGVKVQPLLSSVLYGAAADASEHLLQLISSLSSTVTCTALNGDWLQVKSAFCCSTTTALYWMLGCWLLIGLTMLCCGLPAAVCGRKRFAADIDERQLVLIDRYFDRERVLKEEAWTRHTGSNSRDRLRGRRSSAAHSRAGSVLPLAEEVQAIEMAHLRAETEKAEQEAALKAAHKAEALSAGGAQVLAQRGQEGEGGQLQSEEGRRGESRIEVVVPSPSGSAEASVHRFEPLSPGSRSASDAGSAEQQRDPRGRGEAGKRDSGRPRPMTLQHPMALNYSVSGQSPSPHPSASSSGSLSQPRTPQPGQSAPTQPRSEAPTPLAVLVHDARPPAAAAVGASAGSQRVFSYARDSDSDGEKGEGGRRLSSPPVPSPPSALSPSAALRLQPVRLSREGEREVGGDDSLDEVSSSEDDDDDEAELEPADGRPEAA